jgi:molecular chaperone DnaK
LKDPIVGIDLGTSNSVVAHADEVGVVKVLADDGGYKIHPSVVSFHPNGGVVVGAGAKQRKVIDPANTVYSVKRLIGRAYESAEVQIAKSRSPFAIKEGENKGPVIVTRQGDFAVPEISAIVLDHMRNIAAARLECPVSRAVVTVPASFNDAQRSATATAGSIAGLTVVRVLNEPTAAALAYGNTRNLKEVIAVYDFGGGTFDITILKLNDQVYEVLGTAGDTFLGGDDLDERLVDKMVAKFLAENRFDLRTNEVSMMRLRAVAEQTKIELSRRSRAVVRIDEIAYGPKGKPLNLQIEITRDEFVSQVADIIDRTFPVCQEAMTIAGLGPSDIADVILVGGTTKIPYVRDQVSKFFARAPRTDVNPEEAVAVGAALQANSLERILAKPRTRTSQSVPVQTPSGTFDSIGGTDSFTDVTSQPQPPDLLRADGSLSFSTDQDEVTQTTPATEVARVKRPTQPRAALATPSGDTGYSVKRSGVRDHYRGRTGADDNEETRPAAENPLTSTQPGGADPFESRTPPPNAQPLARLTRPQPAVDPKKTAFGVPAGPPPLPRPTGRGAGAAKPPPPDAPASLDIGGVTFELEGTTPAAPKHQPPKRGLSAVMPAEDSLTLAPDFAAEVDTAEALALADKMAREASAASTAKGMGKMAPTMQAQAQPPPPPPPVVPTASPQMPTMIAPMPIAPGYADDPRRGQQPPQPKPLGPQVARALPTILEVTPRGLGIGTVAGFCEELIRRNERLPATKKKSFTTTARDKQAVVRIVVCQGESRRLDNNTVIGDLVLANLPPRPRGETTIEVTFVIDASGILQVSARDAATGAEQRASLDLVGGVQPQDVAASRERIQQLRR